MVHTHIYIEPIRRKVFYTNQSYGIKCIIRIRLDRELLIFPRIFLEGEYEYRADFGWVNDLGNSSYESETQWLVGASYILSRNFSIQANYNNRYGWGGGLLVRF